MFSSFSAGVLVQVFAHNWLGTYSYIVSAKMAGTIAGLCSSVFLCTTAQVYLLYAVLLFALIPYYLLEWKYNTFLHKKTTNNEQFLWISWNCTMNLKIAVTNYCNCRSAKKNKILLWMGWVVSDECYEQNSMFHPKLLFWPKSFDKFVRVVSETQLFVSLSPCCITVRSRSPCCTVEKSCAMQTRLFQCYFGITRCFEQSRYR